MSGYVRSLSMAAAMLSLVIGLVACVEQPRQRGRSEGDEVFIDASRMLGKHVSVEGYLRWTFENKNLFPVWIERNHLSQKYCLPVLVDKSNKELLARMLSLNGRVVKIEGIVMPVAPPGMISVTNCKQIGVDVTSISED